MSLHNLNIDHLKQLFEESGKAEDFKEYQRLFEMIDIESKRLPEHIRLIFGFEVAFSLKVINEQTGVSLGTFIPVDEDSYGNSLEAVKELSAMAQNVCNPLDKINPNETKH